MADLDNFFAKKDKKKSKSKPKFLTAEELVKNLEDTTKREATSKPKSLHEAPVTATQVGASQSGASGDEKLVDQVQSVEEEWDEFEQEQQKDYTGLKIGQLTLNDEDEQSPLEGDYKDGDSENGVTGGEVKRSAGSGDPWKKVIPAEEVTQIPMEKPSSKLYISPALRNQGIAPARIKVRNRAAPDITNADYFPTLGAARPEEQRKKKNEPAFEEVRHGGRVQRVQETTAAPVSAANRFQSLDEDDS